MIWTCEGKLVEASIRRVDEMDVNLIVRSVGRPRKIIDETINKYLDLMACL